MFCDFSMFAHDIFLFGHPVIDWRRRAGHVFRGGVSGRGFSAGIRGGKRNVRVEGGDSGRRGGGVHGGLHVDIVEGVREE